MMQKREYIVWIVAFYVLTAALLCVGTVYDLQIDRALYNSENGLGCKGICTHRKRDQRFGVRFRFFV